MALELSKAEFPSSLHKKKSTTNKSKVLIFGTNFNVGNDIDVNGTRGRRPTHWYGTITSKVTDGVWLSDNLKVDHEEERISAKKVEAGAGGAEDVSVTVSNATETSDPVIAKAVPTIP
jgi:hypothetical protein